MSKFEDNPGGGRYDHAADDLERSEPSIHDSIEKQKPLIEEIQENNKDLGGPVANDLEKELDKVKK